MSVVSPTSASPPRDSPLSAREVPPAPESDLGQRNPAVASGDTLLERKLRQYTRRPAGGEAPASGETIILGQPGDSLETAFAMAREELAAGRGVRVIAPGVTLARTWPEWARQAPGLTLTEWGAFGPGCLADATREVEAEFEAWTNEAFGGQFGGQPAGPIFFATGCKRFFQRTLIAYPVAWSIARTFPRARVLCVRPGADTGKLLTQLLAKSGGEVAMGEAPRPTRLPWRLHVLGLGAAALTFGLARATHDYVQAAPTFRELRRLRRRDPLPVPESWIGILSDWARMNYHLLDAFAVHEAEHAPSLGVLFLGSIAPWARDEERMRSYHQSEIWPGLGPLRKHLHKCVVEQAAMPEAPLDFAKALGVGATRAARTLGRLSRRAEVRLPSLTVSVAPRELVPWATMDVLRATLGAEAGKELLARVPMGGKTVALVGGNNVAWAPLDLALQAAGATTFDHPHGAGTEPWTGMCASTSAVRLAWTTADALATAGPGVRTIVSGMPLRFRLPPRARRPRRILLASGYVHRDAEWIFGFPGATNRYPHRVFQAELLALVPLLRSRLGSDLEFRWRPHPSDIHAQLEADLARLDRVELSRGRPFEDDAAWADVMVSSLSTIVIEAIFAGIPVFVHVLPEADGLPATRHLAPSRVFFHAEDGARVIAEWATRFGDEPLLGLEPEERSRVTLFGETGEPVPMTEYLGCQRLRPWPVVPRDTCAARSAS
jgi:hypothetical protein